MGGLISAAEVSFHPTTSSLLPIAWFGMSNRQMTNVFHGSYHNCVDRMRPEYLQDFEVVLGLHTLSPMNAGAIRKKVQRYKVHEKYNAENMVTITIALIPIDGCIISTLI